MKLAATRSQVAGSTLVLVAGLLSAGLVTGGAASAGRTYTVSMNVSDTTIVTGQTVQVSGKVRPRAPRKRVLVQVRTATRWVTRSRPLLSRRSTYSSRIRLHQEGAFSIRVVKPGSRRIKRGVSGLRVVRVLTPPVIVTDSLPKGLVGLGYSASIETNGERLGRFRLTEGQLPPGLTLASHGDITGSPTTEGTYGFTVTFDDTETGLSTSKPFEIVVDPGGDPLPIDGSG